MQETGIPRLPTLNNEKFDLILVGQPQSVNDCHMCESRRETRRVFPVKTSRNTILTSGVLWMV